MITTPLSPHFTWAEVIHSSTALRLGIDNSMPLELESVVRNTAIGMEKIRSLLSEPIDVDSWFRCLELNTALKSKPTSQHIKGEAVDFLCPDYGTPAEICKRLIKYQDFLNFDQLILEHTWVHVSFLAIPTVKGRHQVLSLLTSGDYAPGLTDAKGNPL
jgi:zinc D-Ala-D-Ala carboxypeptidase